METADEENYFEGVVLQKENYWSEDATFVDEGSKARQALKRIKKKNE